jgi:hypothetical protein
VENKSGNLEATIKKPSHGFKTCPDTEIFVADAALRHPDGFFMASK